MRARKALVIAAAGVVRQGVADMAEKIEATASSCPDTKIVLAGYSQAAQAVGDTIAGAGRRGGPAVDAAAIDRVAAITLFGDPAFTAGEPFNAADRNRNGVFSRGRCRLDAVADRTRSLCNQGDSFCQNGQSLAAHLDYNGSLNAAQQFIAGKVGG